MIFFHHERLKHEYGIKSKHKCFVIQYGFFDVICHKYSWFFGLSVLIVTYLCFSNFTLNKTFTFSLILFKTFMQFNAFILMRRWCLRWSWSNKLGCIKVDVKLKLDEWNGNFACSQIKKYKFCLLSEEKMYEEIFLFKFCEYFLFILYQWCIYHQVSNIRRTLLGN